MRIHLLLLVLIAGIYTNTACSQSNKQKQYTIIVELERDKTFVTGEIETDTISDNTPLSKKNEEEAYLLAYRTTCLVFIQYTYMNQNKDDVKIRYLRTLILDENGKNIVPDIEFPDRERKEKEIWENVGIMMKRYFEKNNGPLKEPLEQIRIK